jgi:hypothetical protein
MPFLPVRVGQHILLWQLTISLYYGKMDYAGNKCTACSI